MTTVSICDKCGKQINEELHNAQIITLRPKENTKHLCMSCLEDFERWIEKA